MKNTHRQADENAHSRFFWFVVQTNCVLNQSVSIASNVCFISGFSAYKKSKINRKWSQVTNRPGRDIIDDGFRECERFHLEIYEKWIVL